MSLDELAPWYVKAHGELGIREVRGSDDNPEIMKYYRASGAEWVEHDETAWCGAFMGWAIKGHAPLPAEPLRARAWEDWGQPLKEPIPGAICIFQRTSNPKLGHVAQFVQWSKDKSKIYVLGGNQKDAVSIATMDASDFIAARWPPGWEIPSGADLANDSTIKSEGKQLAVTGVTTVTGGGALEVAGGGIPAVPEALKRSAGNATEWSGITNQFIDFGSFLFRYWWLTLGVTILIAGVRIMNRRKRDAKEGKTWAV